jgi:hypothetical protein
MKKSRRWLLLPLVAVLAYLGFRWLEGPAETARDEPPGLLFGRVWLEKVPEKPTEYVQGSYVLETPALGMFQRASAYDFHVEIFQYDQDGGKLKLTFPQTDKSAKITYSIKGCDEMPPFDLCLTLSENPWKGGPKKYYGFRDAEDEAKHVPGVREELRGRAGRSH